MMKPEKYLRGAFGAWEMLIDFPLPAALRARLGGRTDATSKLVGFPLAGAAEIRWRGASFSRFSARRSLI